MNESLLAGASALRKPISDIYEIGKDKFKNELAKWKFNKHTNSLYRKISSVQKVKTIWQVDKEVNLKQFYYPSRVINDKKLIAVNTINKLPHDGSIILQGIVGQGKSGTLALVPYTNRVMTS